MENNLEQTILKEFEELTADLMLEEEDLLRFFDEKPTVRQEMRDFLLSALSRIREDERNKLKPNQQ